MTPRFRSLRFGLKWNLFGAVGLVSSRILRGAIVPKVLNPASYGLFTTVSIFTRYLQFSDVGATAYFTKTLPHTHFNEGPEQEQVLASSTYSLILLSSIPVMLYLGVVAFTYRGEYESFYRVALLILIPTTLLTKLKDFFIAYSLGTQRYREAALATAINNYMLLVGVVIGVYWQGALGGIIGVMAGEATTCLYAARYTPHDLRFSIDRNLLLAWRDKLRLFAVSISDTIGATLDQIFVLRIFDAASLGYYMLGLTFGWLFESLWDVFNGASYPKLTALARTQRKVAIEFIHRSIFCCLLTSLVALPILMAAIEVAIDRYFTKYRAGLEVYHMMVFLGLTRGMMTMLRRAYLSLDLERPYIFSTLGVSALYAGCLTALWWRGVSFQHVVAMIVAANVVIVLFFYIRLSAVRGIVFAKNIALLLVFVAIAAGYQYGLRTTPSAIWTPSVPLAFLILVVAGGCLLVYRERRLIAGYLDGDEEVITIDPVATAPLSAAGPALTRPLP